MGPRTTKQVEYTLEMFQWSTYHNHASWSYNGDCQPGKSTQVIPISLPAHAQKWIANMGKSEAVDAPSRVANFANEEPNRHHQQAE